ncbi:hypothetical protein NC651_021842 [Populus alba x Populus x berolinensis]|nr:hypothetical protein NC651_021842 [Populus alba x Populus x berolinensis]
MYSCGVFISNGKDRDDSVGVDGDDSGDGGDGNYTAAGWWGYSENGRYGDHQWWVRTSVDKYFSFLDSYYLVGCPSLLLVVDPRLHYRGRTSNSTMGWWTFMECKERKHSGIVFSLSDSLANVLHGSRELRVRESTMISLFTFAAKRLVCL